MGQAHVAQQRKGIQVDTSGLTQRVQSTGPADTREQTYRLLSGCAPARVVVDTSLKPGQWYVVRGETVDERLARLAQEERRRLDDENRALALGSGC